MTTHIRKTYGGIHQKAMIGAGLANMKVGNPNLIPSIDGIVKTLNISQAEAAAKVGVTPSAVYRANKVIEKGIDGLAKMVTDKKISLSKAADIAKKTPGLPH